MATIKTGPTVSRIGGKIGNHVYGSWRGRGVIRAAAANRANPNSPRQAALRGGIAAAGKAWKNQLNNNQRNLWNQFAQQAGVPPDPASASEPGSRAVIPQPQPVLTGYDAFVRAAQLTVECGINPIGTPVITPGRAFPGPPMQLVPDESPVIPVNFSLNFDGVNEDVTLGNVLNYDYNQPQSWEMWLRPTLLTGSPRFVVKMIHPASDGWGVFWTGNNFAWELAEFSVGKWIQVTRAQVPFVTWKHLVCTYDGNLTAAGLRIYVNSVVGQVITQNVPLTSSFVSPVDLTIASWLQTAGAYFDGALDCIRNYNRVINQAEVNTLFAGGVGLFGPDPFSDGSNQGCWSFCAGGGNTLFDISGNNYHGALRNMEPGDWTPGWVPCPDIPGPKQLEWSDPDDLPVGGKIRIWCLSYNAHVHRQHVATVDRGVEAWIPTTVRIAGGAEVPIANMPGHYLFQLDAISPDGNQSPPSNTIEVVCPLS